VTPTLVRLTTRRDEHSQDCVAVLRDALARAKKGETIAVAVAEVRRDGTALAQISNKTDRVALIGAVSILQARLTKEILDEDEPA
jgi:hypothetical protein